MPDILRNLIGLCVQPRRLNPFAPETVIAFGDRLGKRRLFRVLKPIAQIVFDDLPPGVQLNPSGGAYFAA